MNHRYQNRPPRPSRHDARSPAEPTAVETDESGGLLPNPRRFLLPTADELAALPADARAVVVGRYERAAGATRPDLPDAERVRQAAFRLVETAADRDPVGRWLKRLRGHFDAAAAAATRHTRLPAPSDAVTAPPSASPGPPSG